MRKPSDLKIWKDRHNILSKFTNKLKILPMNPIYIRWANQQRVIRRTLKPKQIKMLEKIYGWSWDVEFVWNFYYTCIIDKFSENEFLVDEKHIKWLHKQTVNKEKLSAMQLKLLDKIPGWQFGTKWTRSYNKCMMCVTQNIKISHSLNDWRYRHRKKYHSKSLCALKIKLLEKIPNWSWKQKKLTRWEETYSKVQEFIEKNGMLPTTSQNRYLYIWLYRQIHSIDILSKDKVDLLMKLSGIEIPPPNSVWIYQFNRFNNEMKRKNASLKDRWANIQRLNKDLLFDWQLSKLEQIDGWTW